MRREPVSTTKLTTSRLNTLQPPTWQKSPTGQLTRLNALQSSTVQKSQTRQNIQKGNSTTPLSVHYKCIVRTYSSPPRGAGAPPSLTLVEPLKANSRLDVSDPVAAGGTACGFKCAHDHLT